MSEPAQETVLCILAERLTVQTPELQASSQDILGRHGYEFIDGQYIPAPELDAREAMFIPKSTANELGRAMSRQIDGDYSGAITSACGAENLVTQAIYEYFALGNPGGASFKATANTALNRMRVFEEISTEFVSISMKPDDAAATIDHTKKAATTRHRLSRSSASPREIPTVQSQLCGKLPIMR